VFALLLKDWLLLRKERIVIAVVFIALALGVAVGGAGSGFFTTGSGMAIIILLFPSYIAVSYSNAYDFKYGCEPLLACLPPGRDAIVGSKYLLALAANLLIPAAAILRALSAALGLGGDPFPFELFATSFSLSLILAAVELAAYFRFGYMKSRWAAMVVFACAGAIAGLASGAIDTGASPAIGIAAGGSARGESAAFPLLLFVAGVILFALSWLYSVRTYKKKEF
jgi:ABC-type transport system involved in multi-copper enzyme maturation permease subunit